jgi:hypothetical protein
MGHPTDCAMPELIKISTYAVFFDNDDYKGSRMSLLIDDCETQEFRPFP